MSIFFTASPGNPLRFTHFHPPAHTPLSICLHQYGHSWDHSFPNIHLVTPRLRVSATSLPGKPHSSPFLKNQIPSPRDQFYQFLWCPQAKYSVRDPESLQADGTRIQGNQSESLADGKPEWKPGQVYTLELPYPLWWAQTKHGYLN